MLEIIKKEDLVQSWIKSGDTYLRVSWRPFTLRIAYYWVFETLPGDWILRFNEFSL